MTNTLAAPMQQTNTAKHCAPLYGMLALLACLLALFALLAPGRALAAGATQVQVMGSTLADATYYTIGDNGALQPGGNANNYNVHFDPTTSTLYLKDAKIEHSGNQAIYFSGDLTINLSGANEINASSAASCSGIYGYGGSLTITGEGSLTVTATCTAQGDQLVIAGIDLTYMMPVTDLTIDPNVSVTCVAQAASGVTPSEVYGVSLYGEIFVKGALNAIADISSFVSSGVSVLRTNLENGSVFSAWGGFVRPARASMSPATPPP